MTQESESKPRPLPRPHLTVLELSRQLGVSQATLFRWRSAGKGPAWTRISGKRINYQAEDVQAWVRSEEKEVPRTGT
jgi:predicted DNA-binding transcriptional regulator AlpA